MKELDELIENIFLDLGSRIADNEITIKNPSRFISKYRKDLESLKQSIKEQHKKDVVEAYIHAQDAVVHFYDISEAEQYYKDNF